MRLEAEEAERDAAKLEAMRRGLQGVLTELMARGDRVAVEVGRWTFTGPVTHVGRDLASLNVAGSRVDLNLGVPLSFAVVERVVAGGKGRSPDEAPSLRARLLELESSGEPVEIGVTSSQNTLAGRIAAVGADHVAVGQRPGTADWFVPLTALGFVRLRGTSLGGS